MGRVMEPSFSPISTHQRIRGTDRNFLSDSPYLKALLEVNLMARALDVDILTLISATRTSVRFRLHSPTCEVLSIVIESLVD